ncbi:tetratricopeptide repeat protein [Candidatus Gracilibacteria bacterium]|nr:tetratricopeptide repeat protein [Candidatus Gracilibacteria bacterium]
MSKKKFWWIGVVVGIIVLGSILWIFHEPLQKLFQQSISSSIGIQPQKGVRRKTSLIGRIREAQKLIDHEYYSLATIELSTAISENSDLIQPYLLLGEIYIREQQSEKLQNLLVELKKKFPTDPEVAVLDGRSLIMQKKFQEAVSTLEKLGNDLPPALKFYHAVLLALQNNHTKAKTILTSLQEISVEERTFVVGEDGVESTKIETSTFLTPEESKKVNDLLHSYDEFGKLSEGKNPHLFATLSKALAQNNEAILAKEFADVSIKEDIQYIDAWILRGYSNYLLKNFDEALSDLRHAYDMDPLRPQTHYFLALVLNETGHEEEATLFFEKALEHNFEFSDEVRWKLIDLFTNQKKYDKALQLYEELLDANTAEEHYVSALHTAIDIVKKPELALSFATKLIETKPTDDFALNMYGWALIANKRFIEAEETLRSAEQVNPQNPRTYLNLGLLYEEQSKFTEAKEFYKKSYDLGKGTSANIITNLAAEKYNELLAQIEKPEEPEAPINPENSP